MPIQEGKYVTPAWQNGGPPALDAAELTDIGNSIVKNQTDIEQNTTNIQSANSSIQQNKQDIESLQTWQSTATSQISNIQTNYLQKSGGTMTGTLNMGNKQITNLATSAGASSAVNNTRLQQYALKNSVLITSLSVNLNSSSDESPTAFNFDYDPRDYIYSYMLIDASAYSGSDDYLQLYMYVNTNSKSSIYLLKKFNYQITLQNGGYRYNPSAYPSYLNNAIGFNNVNYLYRSTNDTAYHSHISIVGSTAGSTLVKFYIYGIPS